MKELNFLKGFCPCGVQVNLGEHVQRGHTHADKDAPEDRTFGPPNEVQVPLHLGLRVAELQSHETLKGKKNIIIIGFCEGIIKLS